MCLYFFQQCRRQLRSSRLSELTWRPQISRFITWLNSVSPHSMSSSKRRDVQTRNSWISDASVAQPQGCRPRISRRRYCGEYENPGWKRRAPPRLFLSLSHLCYADNNKLNPKAVYAGFSSLNGKRNTSPASDPYLRSPLRLHIQRKAHIPRARIAPRELRNFRKVRGYRLSNPYYEAAILPATSLANFSRKWHDATRRDKFSRRN